MRITVGTRNGQMARPVVFQDEVRLAKPHCEDRRLAVSLPRDGNNLATRLATLHQHGYDALRETRSRKTRPGKQLTAIPTRYQYHACGRRAGLKIRWGNTRVGSSPTFGTRDLRRIAGLHLYSPSGIGGFDELEASFV
jgi:hypothetical protein